MKKRSRRTPEQQIADLNARIAAIQARAEQRKALKDPAGRHIASALRSIDRGLAESKRPATRQALEEARAKLAACISPGGAAPPAGGGGRRRKPAPASLVDPEAILRYLAINPGSRCEDVASALGADTRNVSPVLKTLKDDGRARTEGQARGTKYFVGRER